MMKNTIVASVAFSYQGEHHHPAITVDLDAVMKTHGYVPELHAAIARDNGIDTYSYLYEVMESQAIDYSAPTGLAVDCCADGDFDAEQFARLWQRQQALAVLAPIARQHLGIDDLTQHPALASALQDAFLAGKDSAG